MERELMNLQALSELSCRRFTFAFTYSSPGKYTAVWLQDDLKLNINMDHAAAGRPVIRYTAYTNVDPQWGNYTLDDSVLETLFLVENEADDSLLELQDWKITDVSVPTEIFLVIHQDRAGEIGVKKADSDDFVMASPVYTIRNGP